MQRKSERGATRLKTALLLLVVAGVGYGAFKIVPCYVNNYQLQDAMRSEARFSGVQRKSAEQVREEVYKQAKQLGILAKPEDIQVVPVQNGYSISLNYTVPVDLLGYQLALNFHPAADVNSF
jgi:uncharacterized protein DUF4845